MCRLMAYVGPPVLVADVVLWPDRSIIKQSYDARERIMDSSLPSHLAHGNLNGDGFGIGWHNSSTDPDDPTPCVFTSVTPAWNNDNLGRLASKIISPVVFAHVRAAMPGMPVSEQNCHPFQWGRYLWMHNGVVGGFMRIRRALLRGISDAAYDTVQSFHSDSAIAFAIFLHHLPDLGSRHNATTLLQALEATLAFIAETQAAAGVEETSLLNFVVSDGHTTVATRAVFPPDEAAASLYYAEGSAFQRASVRAEAAAPGGGGGGGEGLLPTASLGSRGTFRDTSVTDEAAYCVESAVAGGTRVVLVASEPITRSSGDWVAVPKNTALVVSRGKAGHVDIIRTPLHASGRHARQGEVKQCLDAVASGAEIDGRLWRLPPKRPLPGPANGGGGPGRPEECEVTASGRLLDHSLTGHRGAVLCLAHWQDRLLFSASADCTIKAWDTETCVCVKTLAGHTKPVADLRIRGGFLYSVAGRRVRVWDLASLACVRQLHAQDDGGALRALALGPGAVHVAGQDAVLRTFQALADSGAACATPPAGELPEEAQLPAAVCSAHDSHCAAVHGLAACGELLATAGGDAMIRLWRAAGLELRGVLRGHRGAVLTLFSLGGLLLSGGRDNIIRVWDMDALVCRRTLAGHTDDVLCITGLDLSAAGPAEEGGPDGEGGGLRARRGGSAASLSEPGRRQSLEARALFASASADSTVRLWSSSTWGCLRLILPPASHGPFTSVGISHRHLVTGSAAGVVGLWPMDQLVGGALACPATRACSSESWDSDTTSALQAPRRKRVRARHPPGSMDRELEAQLRDFVALKTVSSDASLREDCYQGAKYLCRLLQEVLGAEVKMSRVREDKNPVVLGRLGRLPQRPTITFYGHYDVQPAMEREWQSDPFEVAARDGYLYGRGTSDNKGPILGFIYAVKELLEEGKASHGSLPVNVAFVFEGEEENGSVGFEEAVRANLGWFEGTQLVVISNTLWVGERVPCLTYGMRGMIAMSIEVRGPQRDLHSGNEGGVFNEPTSDLTKLLGGLVDGSGRIRVPGWYEGVRHNTLAPALEKLDAVSPPEFTLGTYRASLGLPELKSQSVHELLRARWCEPTLSIVDVRVGDDQASAGDPHYRFGPTRFSVIPRLAVGNISVRYVPDQRPEELLRKLTAHVQAQFAALGSANAVAVRVKSVGDWWEADPQSRLFRLAENALFKEWKMWPLYVREGGTMPVASTLEKLLGAPALLVPFGQASDNCHLANERLQRSNLLRGKNVIKNLLLELEMAAT